jgi:hypothetical protein
MTGPRRVADRWRRLLREIEVGRIVLGAVLWVPEPRRGTTVRAR